ncbi:tRNA-specific adenosine deaminase [Thermobispora bispora]|jgi:tRNA(adenine34) deaminase|uniref:tRNA-specific adenosine deaminase n=1 Tax=Thermobispora bispora (strain ATCC 19993 / DSM 43833 / CBS 139.67 / JCM 10125 / KCTC 9307 / NBRC 14880 / R51) TaxID=469371 RepID=D6YAH1_THEBD|nr:tRNA adenosine(34) deaminase TadA [Thermobispora bispora]ADG90224.1 CMP/dCMP deaminase zinc-binding protein [Thermobispora bispora DSM 43833]MDI9579929.1 tRNA adenosine(34) deaminase TadA [Thermobispora sp.]
MTQDYEPAMRLALAEAVRAGERGEVPVGAVVLGPDGTVLAAAGNDREASGDPTAHAEVLALRAAARALGTWRLSGCTLVVTLEPCTMCAGAAVLARVDRVVYGAADEKAGAAGSLWDVLRDRRLNHRPEVVLGVLAEECGAVLRSFFAGRRG